MQTTQRSPGRERDAQQIRSRYASSAWPRPQEATRASEGLSSIQPHQLIPFPRQTVTSLDGRFLSVDNTRFWCMFAVVAVHCARVFTFASHDNAISFYVATTLFKFGSIGFFLVSGFLLEHSLRTRTASSILGKRFQKVFFPWLLWSVLYVFSLSLSDSTQHRFPFASVTPLHSALLVEAGRSLTSTSLWFVPNLFVSLGVLLLFRKHLSQLRFGAVLLAANLFYVANIYGQWIPPEHNRAIFAFIFYLWLGHYAATHLAALNRLLASLTVPVLLILTSSSAALSFAEARLLLHINALDPLNTLRISNQTFSILVVLCFSKLRRPSWPKFVDVPRHTFGIYLSHAIVVAFILTLTRRLLDLPSFAWVSDSVLFRTLLWITATVIAWTAGFLLSRFIAASPSLCWLQGVPPLRYKSLPDRRSAPRKKNWFVPEPLQLRKATHKQAGEVVHVIESEPLEI